MFVLFGDHLGPAELTLANALPLPTELANTSIAVSVSGVSRRAYIVYVSKTQLAAVLPSDTPQGQGTVTVTRAGSISEPAPIRVTGSAFGAFTADSSGVGQIVAQNVSSDGSTYTPNGALNPARPGQYVVIWGTGLGSVQATQEAAAPMPAHMAHLNTRVQIGGKSAEVVYGGRSGCCVGVDQIAMVVPEGLNGCELPVTIETGGTVSSGTTIAVAPAGSACYSDKLPAGASSGKSFASLTLVRSAPTFPFVAPGAFVSETYMGYFLQLPSVASGSFAALVQDELIATLGRQAVEGCTVSTSTRAPGPALPPLDPFAGAQGGGILSAGSRLVVENARGTRYMPQQADKSYRGGAAATLGVAVPGSELVIGPGTVTVHNENGGPNVGAFRVSAKLPQFLLWSNKGSISSVNRLADLPIAWSGGESPFLVGIEIRATTACSESRRTVTLTCNVPSAAGRFSVPSVLLRQLPPVANSRDATITVGLGGELVRFSAPGLDYGFLLTSGGADSKQINIE